MTEKGTPLSPTLSPARAEEREKNVAGAKHVPDVSRRNSGSYKTVHWQALDPQDGSRRVSLVTSAAPGSLVTQRLNRIELGGFHSRDHPGDNTDHDAEGEGHEH